MAAHARDVHRVGAAVVAVACLALGGGAGADDPPLAPKDVQRLVGEILAAAPAARPALLDRLRPADALKRGEIKGWVSRILAAIQARPRPAAGDPLTLAHPDFPMRYTLLGAAKPGDAAVIYLHRGGGDAALNDRGWALAKSMAPDMGFPLTCVPRVFDDASMVGFWEESGLVALAALIDELKRVHRVDPDRIYLGGYSMGGWATAVAGPALADRLAGIFAMGGGSRPDAPLENLRNTPFAIRIGQADTDGERLQKTRGLRDDLARLRAADPDGYEVAYQEYPGFGHNIPPAAHPEIGAWLRTRVRDPYPKVLVWRPTSPHFRHFHWLWAAPGVEGRILAKITAPNRVEVEAPADAGLTEFLNDQMVDLGKPVVVTLNGAERWDAVVPYSLTALVETLAAKEDPKMFFTARVDLR